MHTNHKTATKREVFLEALRNEPVDELVWAPNFDYWLRVNTAEGTLPEEYRGLSRNDIVRAIGGTIWNRVSCLRRIFDSSVRETNYSEGDASIHEYHTPIGSVREVSLPTEGSHRTRYLAEHFVKDLDSLLVMIYVVRASSYEADYSAAEAALRDTGDDGIVLAPAFCVPFIQFSKTDAGYLNAFYLWADYRKEVDELIQAYFEKFLEGYRLLAASPVDVVATGDNMDGRTISPSIFKEYAIPFYQEVRKIVAAAGKLFEGHWCGRTESLLPLVPGCGLDIVESIVTQPMANLELSEALDILHGEVVLQGGIPSVLVCEEGGTREDFRHYIEEVILPLKDRRGFILGMADNVPPNADFERVRMVAELINS